MRGYSEVYKKIIDQIKNIQFLLGEPEYFYQTNVFADYRISPDNDIGNFNIAGFNIETIKDKQSKKVNNYLKLYFYTDFGLGNLHNKSEELLLTDDMNVFIKTELNLLVLIYFSEIILENIIKSIEEKNRLDFN